MQAATIARPFSIVAFTLFTVVGATSVSTADTVVTEFSVTAAAGGLTVANASATSTAGSVEYDSGSATSVTGNMPNVTITDDRGTLTTWQVDVVADANFDDGADDTANDGTNSVAATNAVVFFPVDNATNLLAAAVSANLMTLTGCVCNATGAGALLTADLGTSYTLVTGAGSSLLSTPSITLAPDFHVSVPANTPVADYSAQITFTAS